MLLPPSVTEFTRWRLVTVTTMTRSDDTVPIDMPVSVCVVLVVPTKESTSVRERATAPPHLLIVSCSARKIAGCAIGYSGS
jgi:hypothetical protein